MLVTVCVCEGMGCGKSRLHVASRDQCCVGLGEHGREKWRTVAKSCAVGWFSFSFVTLGSGGRTAGWAIPGCVIWLETIPGCSLPKHFSLSLLLNQRENCHKLEIGLWKLEISRSPTNLYMIEILKILPGTTYLATCLWL